MAKTTKGKQGFASMDPKRQQEIARLGGQSQGKDNNPGNFANDTAKAKRAGHEGGSKSTRSS